MNRLPSHCYWLNGLLGRHVRATLIKSILSLQKSILLDSTGNLNGTCLLSLPQLPLVDSREGHRLNGLCKLRHQRLAQQQINLLLFVHEFKVQVHAVFVERLTTQVTVLIIAVYLCELHKLLFIRLRVVRHVELQILFLFQRCRRKHRHIPGR